MSLASDTVEMKSVEPDILKHAKPILLNKSCLAIEAHSFASGLEGNLYRGTFKGASCVVKKKKMVQDDSTLEIAFLSSSQEHSHIIKLYGVIMDVEEGPWLILEECKHTLDKCVVPGKKTSLAQKVKYAHQLASALEFLHTRGVIHRDIKPSNVMISFHTDEVRLIDFGLACCETQDRRMTGETGSYRFMAPEVFSHVPHYTCKVDVYSFSLILYFLFTGFRPFFEFTDAVEAAKSALTGRRPTKVDFKLHDQLRPIMQRGWAHDANARPRMSEILFELEGLFVMATPPSSPWQSLVRKFSPSLTSVRQRAISTSEMKPIVL